MVGESSTLYVSSASSELSLIESLSKSLSNGLNYSNDIGANLGSGKNPIQNASFFQFDMSKKRDISSKYKNNYVYVTVRARKNFTSESMTEHLVNEEIPRFFENRERDFFNRCGDRFVSGILKGAEVVAIMSCETSSVEVKNKITNEVNLKGGYIGFGASVLVQELLDKVKQQTSQKCVIEVSAFGGKGVIDTSSSDQFIKSSLNYVASASLDSAIPLEFETIPYSAILNKEFQEKILDKTDLKMEQQREFIKLQKDLITSLSQQIDRLAGLTPMDSSRVEPLLQAIESSRQAADLCIRNPYKLDACKSRSRFPRIGS